MQKAYLCSNDSGLQASGTMPERLQGRMNATITFVVFGLPTLGALLGGILGQYLGLPATHVIAAVGDILACLWIVFSPVRTIREVREEPEGPQL